VVFFDRLDECFYRVFIAIMGEQNETGTALSGPGDIAAHLVSRLDIDPDYSFSGVCCKNFIPRNS